MKHDGESELFGLYTWSKNLRPRIPQASPKMLAFIMPDKRVFWGFTVSIDFVDGRVRLQGGGNVLLEKQLPDSRENSHTVL